MNFGAESTARYFRVKRKVVRKLVSFAINDVLVCFPVFTVEETVDEVGDIMVGVAV